ncbi:unnamed protein product [Triticum aestivum]|uniref:Uncharacterized protein n=2 Tax=Triticum aestivum TaxID=4565 RepID=A0A9R1MKD8_WHEAT|nr:uncharacterized protein LOC123049930 [Triticum aestivum]KAF7108976.1 hypothetical protein CFC21_109324 [Triticum aestivum]SPT19773.1 unnamed protein product [Triticum aestivum]
MATSTRSPLPPADPEKEKPLARSAPATAPADLANPEKKMRRPVPMTDEERKRIKDLKEQHRSGMEGLREYFQIHKELRHHHDELLFRRRCLAARLVSRIAFQRHDAAYIKHQRDLGLKLGDKLPEELKKIGPPMGAALVMWAEMCRALNIGMDNYITECDNPEAFRGRMRSLGLIRDEKGAPQDCVAPQE